MAGIKIINPIDIAADFAKSAGDTVNAIGDSIVDVVNVAGETISDAGSAVTQMATNAGDTIISAANNVGQTIGGAGAFVANGINDIIIVPASGVFSDIGNSLSSAFSDLSSIRSIDDFNAFIENTKATLTTNFLSAGEAVLKFGESMKDGIEGAFAASSAAQLEYYGVNDPMDREEILQEIGEEIAVDHVGEMSENYWNSEEGQKIDELSYLKHDGAYSSFKKGATTTGLYILSSLHPAGWAASLSAISGESYENTIQNGGTLNDAYAEAAPMAILDLGLNAIGGTALSEVLTKGLKDALASGKSAATSFVTNISNFLGDLKITKPALETASHESGAILGRFNNLLADERGFLNIAAKKTGEKQVLVGDVIQNYGTSVRRKNFSKMKSSLVFESDQYIKKAERIKDSLDDAIDMKTRLTKLVEDPSLPPEQIEYYKNMAKGQDDAIEQYQAQLKEINDKREIIEKKISILNGDWSYGSNYFSKLLSSIDENNVAGMAFVNKLNNVFKNGDDFAIMVSRDANKCYYDPHYNVVVMDTVNQAWEDVGTLSHELGHMLHYKVLNAKIPANFDAVTNNARVLFTQNNGARRFSNIYRKSVISSNLSAYNELANVIEKELVEKGVNPALAKPLSFLKIDQKALDVTTDKIGRNSQTSTPALYDIIDALFGGTRKDLNGNGIKLRYGHGSDYYLANQQSQFDEMIANFTQLKVANSQNDLNMLREICGEDFYNMLENTFNEMVA